MYDLENSDLDFSEDEEIDKLYTPESDEDSTESDGSDW